jgi:hypothetical protein
MTMTFGPFELRVWNLFRISCFGFRGLRLLIASCLLSAGGCYEQVDTLYGRGRGSFGAESVNGTAVLQSMFEQAGHRVSARTRLSPSLRARADCIVWFPDDYDLPNAEVRDWLDDWLCDEPDRTLIYVGRDYDAGEPYWTKVQAGAPPGQLPLIGQRITEERSRFQVWRGLSPAKEDCQWFSVDNGAKPRKVRTLDGAPGWLAGVDPSKVEIELNGRVRPSSTADVLLESEGDMLVSAEPWCDGRLIVVANGSFLLNLPLVNHEHRKLAGKLIEEVGPAPKDVVFLESRHGGPRIYEDEPSGKTPTGLELFGRWPTNWILLQLAVVGIIFCFSRLPIFGRPRTVAPEGGADFGQHLRAMGELLGRSRDRDYAEARLAGYHQIHSKASEPKR